MLWPGTLVNTALTLRNEDAVVGPDRGRADQPGRHFRVRGQGRRGQRAAGQGRAHGRRRCGHRDPAWRAARPWSPTASCCCRTAPRLHPRRRPTRPGPDMNLSETCIRRPVMTTLITASLIVFGIFGYRLLSVAALPRGRLPDHRGHRDAAGREPGDHGGLGRVADRAAVLDHRRHLVDDLDVDARPDPHHHPVRPQPQHRRRGARRADRAYGRAAPAAGRDDDAAVVPQGQSRRLPGPVHQPDLADAAAVDGRRIRPDRPGAADLAAAGRRPGAGLRLAEIRRARPGRSGGGRRAQHLARRHPHRAVQGQLQHAGRHADRLRAERHAAGVRRDAARRRITATSWRPGATARRSSSSEIANVIDSVENDKVASWFNGERAVVLAIQRQPDANTVEVVDLVQAPSCRSSARRCRPRSAWRR